MNARLLTVRDEMLEPLTAICRQAHVRAVFGAGPVEPTQKDVAELLFRAKPGTYTESWIIAVGERIVGCISLANINPVNRCGEITNRVIEGGVGWMLGSWVARAVLQHAFDGVGLNRVECWVHDDNAATHALCRRMARRGVVLEGVLKQAVWRHGRFVDVSVYAVTRDRWN